MPDPDDQIVVKDSARLEPAERRHAVGRVALGIGAVGAAILLPLLRQRGVHSWDTVWAEDGWVFVQQAENHGASALLRGYAGYLQLPPRLMGGPTPLVPVPDLALYLALVASTTCALLALFTYWATAGWIISRPVRAALAAFVVLMPALGPENTATITNTLWTFLAVAPWAFLARRERPAAVVVRGVVAFLAAASSPVSVVFAPLAIGCGVKRRTRASWVVVGVYLGGLALQAAVTATTTDTRASPIERDPSALPAILGIRLFAQYLVGDRGIVASWDQWHTLAVVASLLVVVGLFLLLRGAEEPSRSTAAGLVVAGLVTFLVSAWTRGTKALALTHIPSSFFSHPELVGVYKVAPARYSVVPVFMIACAVALLVGAPPRADRWGSRPLRILFVAHVVVVCAVGFRVTNARSVGPAWPLAAEQARRVQCHDPGDRFSVPLPAPFFNPPVTLSCDD